MTTKNHGLQNIKQGELARLSNSLAHLIPNLEKSSLKSCATYVEGLLHTEMQRREHGEQAEQAQDQVNHPAHYTSHPSGVECIQVTEHMGFSLGNAVKYIWRADLKNDAIEDLEKARWYIERELKRRRQHAND